MEIIHDLENKEFFCIIDGLKSKVSYNINIQNKTINFNHTYVPEKLRNKGIAKALYDEALKFIIKEKLTENSTCSYARKYFDNLKNIKK